MTTQPEVAEAAENLSRSLSRLARTTTDYVHTRLDQADDAMAAESRRTLWILLSSGALLLTLWTGAVFTGLAVTMVAGEANRVLAAALVAAAFFVLAGVAAWVLRFQWHRRPALVHRIARLAAFIALFRRAR